MATKVSVRLDNESRQLLEDLKLRLGWSYSKIVREGILLLAAEYGFYEPKKIIGIGAFDSGIPDPATNKAYLKDLGVKSMGNRSEREK
jgi:hypothetical protein